MNNHVKDLKILIFKVIFYCLKLVEYYIKEIFLKPLIFKVLYRPVARSENPGGGGAGSTVVGIICPPG